MTIRKIAFSGVIGAIYAVLTMVLAPISFGPLQLRVAEVLCILPFFFPTSTWGLFAGCLIANLLSTYGLFDVVFGSLATLLACLITAQIGRADRQSVGSKLLACLPPVIMNGLIIGAVIAWMTARDTFWSAMILNGATVALGEFIVMYVIGFPLMLILPKTGIFTFLKEKYGL